MKTNTKILTSQAFIISLLLLLINDFFLKKMYGNWITGKLSDFAGLFVFVLFWTALFPHLKKFIFASTALFFIFWKSSYSQFIINSWNNLELLNLHRTVDYSDLIAFFILPFAYNFETRIDEAKKIKIHPIFPILLAAFSFIATSYQSDLEINKTYSFAMPKDTLTQRMNTIYHMNSGNTISFKEQNPDTVVFSTQSNFCDNYIDIKLIVSEKSEKSSELNIVSIVLNCPKGTMQQEDFLKEFETIYVDKINKGL